MVLPCGVRIAIALAFLSLGGCSTLLGIDELSVGGDAGATDAAAACTAGENFCDGDQVYSCYANGTRGELLAECALGLCGAGACIDSCADCAATTGPCPGRPARERMLATVDRSW